MRKIVEVSDKKTHMKIVSPAKQCICILILVASLFLALFLFAKNSCCPVIVAESRRLLYILKLDSS